MTKKIVVQLGRKKHKGMTVGNGTVRPRSEKQLAADKRNRERLLADDRFVKGAPPEGGAWNKSGNNQHTSPKGHDLISKARKAYINDVAPDSVCEQVHLSPGATWADVIAMQQIIVAAGGSLAHTQAVEEGTEGKMNGPGGALPVLFNPIAFVEPKKNG